MNEYHKEKEPDMTLHVIGPDVSSSDAAPTAGDMKPTVSLAFGRGRRGLDRSVWYNGWLMTFLVTGEETQGQFALIEAVGRRGDVPKIFSRSDGVIRMTTTMVLVKKQRGLRWTITLLSYGP